MSQLPKDELLSAYLDGEVNAAERAEAERLLATDPAARQTFEAWKAVQAELHAMPKQTFDHDISRDVLQAAEQRKQAEEDTFEGEPVEPLSTHLWRRATNPHTWVWLSITAVIVAAIVIRDRQQHPREANHFDREIALSAAKSQKSGQKGVLQEKADGDNFSADKFSAGEEQKRDVIPSMRAYEPEKAKDAVARLKAKHSKISGEASDLSKSEEAVDADALADRPASKSASPSVAAAAAPKPAERLAGKAAADEKTLSYAAKSPMPAKAGKATEKRAFGAAGLAANAPATPLNAPPALHGELNAAANASSGMASVRNTLNAKGGRASDVAPPTLVVYCDITPEAARAKSLNKLLDAKGIRWHREETADHRARRNRADISEKRREFSSSETAAANKKTEDRKPTGTVANSRLLEKRKSEQQPVDVVPMERKENAEWHANAGDDVVFVEATPSQVQAALADLSSHPSDFLAVSIGNPVNRGQAVNNLAQADKQTTPVAKPLLAKQEAPSQAQQQLRQQPVSIVKPQSQSQLAQQAQSQPAATVEQQAVAPQQVVFVLRIVKQATNDAPAKND